MNLSTKIRQFRKKGLSYRQIGEKLKMSRQYIWYVSKGKSLSANNYQQKICFWCKDKIFGQKYYVRPWNKKSGLIIDEGCALLLDSKGIIDPNLTRIVK